MKVVYEFDDSNEADIFKLRRYEQTDSLHRAVDDFSNWLRDNTKYWQESCGLDESTMVSVRDMFHEFMNENNVNLDI